jgi:hypothetical protein
MTFIFSCLFYSFIGCITGFFSHIFNGLIQKHIKFDTQYVLKTVFNFFKILGIMTFATLLTGLFIISVPGTFLKYIGVEVDFFHQLVFYLFAFAAFDFGLKIKLYVQSYKPNSNRNSFAFGSIQNIFLHTFFQGR